MRKTTAFLLALVLMLPLWGTGLAETRLEGEGFDTPEDAVLAYLDGMNGGDAGAMLATFAIETFVDRLDPDAYLMRVDNFSPMTVYGIPLTDGYARSLAVSARYGSLADLLRRQYIELSAGLNGLVRHPMGPAEREELRAQFESSPLSAMQGHVEFVAWIDLADIAASYVVKPGSRIGWTGNNCYFDPDDLIELAAHIRINGMDAVQFMQCALYGDRWYNITPQGDVAYAMGLYSDKGGLLTADSAEGRELFAAYRPGSAPQDMQDVRDAVEGSPLRGTRWMLRSFGMDGVTVTGDRDAAVNGGGTELWAELHFLGTGGAVLTLSAAPALHETFGMGGGTGRIILAWTESGGELAVQGMRAYAKSLTLASDVTGLRYTGTEIAVDFADGGTAVFAPAERGIPE